MSIVAQINTPSTCQVFLCLQLYSHIVKLENVSCIYPRGKNLLLHVISWTNKLYEISIYTILAASLHTAFTGAMMLHQINSDKPVKSHFIRSICIPKFILYYITSIYAAVRRIAQYYALKFGGHPQRSGLLSHRPSFGMDFLTAFCVHQSFWLSHKT